MKVVYVARSYVPSYTANSIAVMKMSEAFANSGCKVTLLIVENDLDYELNFDPFEFYGIKNKFDIIKLPPRNKKLTNLNEYIKLIHSEICNLNPDLIYTRDNTYRYLLHQTGYPLVAELHTEVSKELEKFHDFLNSESLKKIVVINKFLKNYYAKSYHIRGEKIVVAHSSSDNNDCTERIDLPGKNNLNIGYIGHLYPGKGIEIVSELIKVCQWADFHIVGGTSEDINRWNIELSAFNNSFIHGFKPYIDIKKYTNSMDILLAPYQTNIDCSGGGKLLSDWISPLKIFDYMSSGKAIIASDLPSIREVLEDGRTALLCKYDNLNEWIDELERLHLNDSLRHRLGRNAKNDFINLYTWDIRAAKILNSLSN